MPACDRPSPLGRHLPADHARQTWEACKHTLQPHVACCCGILLVVCLCAARFPATSVARLLLLTSPFCLLLCLLAFLQRPRFLACLLPDLLLLIRRSPMLERLFGWSLRPIYNIQKLVLMLPSHFEFKLLGDTKVSDAPSGSHSGELHRHASILARLRSLATLAKRKHIRSLLQILHNPAGLRTIILPLACRMPEGAACKEKTAPQGENGDRQDKPCAPLAPFSSNVGLNKSDLDFAMHRWLTFSFTCEDLVLALYLLDRYASQGQEPRHSLSSPEEHALAQKHESMLLLFQSEPKPTKPRHGHAKRPGLRPLFCSVDLHRIDRNALRFLAAK